MNEAVLRRCAGTLESVLRAPAARSGGDHGDV